MSKHTPGPWEANGYHIRQRVTGTRSIAEVAYTGPHHTPAHEYPKSCRLVDEANACLIAAAPELLEALELYALSYTDEELVQLAECTSGMGEISPVTAKREVIRRAAIAKAKGEQL